MTLVIRPVRSEDASSLHQISLQDAVLPYMAWTPSLRIEQMEKRINNLCPSDHEFVAEHEGNIVGYISLIQGRGRRSHVGDLFLGVSEEYHCRGIGTALITKVLDLADNWLLLERVTLEVQTSNPRAQKLYERFGFIIEGKRKGAIVCEGQYTDLVMMCRFRPNGVLSSS